MLLVALGGLARGAVVRSGNQRTLPASAIAFAFVFSIVLRRVPVFPRVFLFLTPLLLFLVLNNQLRNETVLKQQNVPLSWATRFTVAAAFPHSKLLMISVPASAG